MSSHTKNAVILFSGGLDSTTCLAHAKHLGFACHALSFNYGQRHSSELNAAKKIAQHFNAHHHIFNLPIDQFGASSLTDSNLAIPDYEAHSTAIPSTYVPARNTIFLAVALAYAETLQARDIFIGVSHVDYSNYPDCRPEFIQAFQTLCNLGTKLGVEEGGMTIHTPLIHLSKADTIKMGHALGIDYRMTISCYQANENGEACGKCASCGLRKKGFAEADLPDATNYIFF